MVEGEVAREGKPNGHNGKPLHGGITMQKKTKSYALFLKNQWMQFQIKNLAQHGSMLLQDYTQLIELCDQSIIVDKDKLNEFYMHNLTLTNMNIWDHSEKLGDMQPMALASWMTHDEARVDEEKKVMQMMKRSHYISGRSR